MRTGARQDARTQQGDAATALFAGPGEMRARCRGFDWAATPLGPVERWPVSLRTTAAIVLGSSFPMIVVWGPELIQIYNDAYIPLIGRKHPRALGMATHACWPEIRSIQEPIFARVFRGETVQLTEAHYALDRRDAGVPDDAYFDASFVPVPLEDGGIGGSVSTLLESTDRMRRQAVEVERDRLLAERDAEHRRLLAVLEQSPVGIVVAEAPSGRFLFTNRQVKEIFGESRLLEGVAQYSKYRKGYHLDNRPIQSHEWPLARAVERGETIADEVLRVERVDGRQREITVNAAPVRDARGEIIAAIAMYWDVTEQRRHAETLQRARVDAETARAAAEAANRAKSEFLAVMSHELRTPLNAIGGYAELLEMGLRGPVTSQQRADLERIQQSQKHLLGLINDVLNYARIETGTVRYVLRDVPLAQVVTGAEALVAPQMRAKELTLVIVPCDHTLTVRADEEKVRQILLNLLTNALKFTDAGGTITVACAADTERAAVTVADTGIGIEADKLASIFDPFVQVNAKLTRPQEGVGLGLAISRDLARGMGGDLRVRSTLGEGSTFTLTLPTV